MYTKAIKPIKLSTECLIPRPLSSKRHKTSRAYKFDTGAIRVLMNEHI